MHIKKFSIISYLVILTLVVLGWWADFVPSAAWSKHGGYLSIGVATFYCSLAIWALLTNRLGLEERKSSRYVAILFTPIILYPALWLGTVHGVGFVSAQVSFEFDEREAILSKGSRNSRRQCDHFLTGSLIYDAVPNHYCISEELYESLPSRGNVILSTRENSLGTLIMSARK